jgi:hypothetical protein
MDIPVIVISAFASGEEEQSVGEVVARFSKPFDMMALLEAVRRVAVAEG